MQGEHLETQLKECYRKWVMWGYFWSALSIGFIWSLLHPWSWEIGIMLGCLGGGITYRYYVKSFSEWLIWFDRHSSEPYLIESAWEANQNSMHSFASPLALQALSRVSAHPKKDPKWPVKPALILIALTSLTFTPPSKAVFTLNTLSSSVSRLTRLFTSPVHHPTPSSQTPLKKVLKEEQLNNKNPKETPFSSTQSPKSKTSLKLDSASSSSSTRKSSSTAPKLTSSSTSSPPSHLSPTSKKVRIKQRQSQAGARASQAKDRLGDLEVREYTLKEGSQSLPSLTSRFKTLESSVQPKSLLSPLKKRAPPLTPYHFSVRYQSYLKLSTSP